ncbi:hypothetical protein CLU79DRAFT_498226 [Phycomyces nitens]|nr:hypothetical protein CLU79DRAFT_498226 [Phycomyces nitens]
MTSLTKAPLLFAFFLGVVRSQDPATDPIAADGNNSDTENEASDTKLPSIDPGLPIPTTLSSSVDGPFPTSSEPTAEPLETSADLPASSEPTAQPLETPTAFSTSLEPTAQPFESSTALSTPSEQTLETIATPYPTPTPTPSIPVPTESSGASILVSPSYSSI